MLRRPLDARVSVVIPVHNGVEFIAEAVQSALAQTHPPYECVVVDDGSTDGTADVLAPFGDAVRVIRQPRAGVAAARNVGIRATGGDAIALLDADDVWLPHKLGRQLVALDAHPGHGAVCSGYVMTDRSLVGRRAVPVPDGPMDVVTTVMLEAAGVGFSFTGLVTRAAVGVAGLFDERLSTRSDIEFAWRVARRTGLVGVSEPLALYRRHGGQMHRDLGRLEHDMDLMLRDGESAGLTAVDVHRARANLQTYLGFRRLLAGDLLQACAHLRVAARLEARRVVAQPASAVARRVRQDLALRRWNASADRPAAPVTVGASVVGAAVAS